MIQNGHIGQVQGPFQANKDLLDDDGPIGVLTPEKERPVLFKLGIQASQGDLVKINDTTIKIGKTGIYELDEVVKITSVIFLQDVSADTIVDFVYTGRTW